MKLSFGQVDVIILDPDVYLSSVINRAFEKFYRGYWTTRDLKAFYNYIANLGYSVVIQAKNGEVFLPSDNK